MVIGEDEEEIGRGGWGEMGEEEEREKEEQGFHLGGGWQVGVGEITGNVWGEMRGGERSLWRNSKRFGRGEG